ncbi:MAG TPA: hypothetical protein VJR27_05320 [Candidatus Saccharimonadales bacterium]|nr:hypothetical protein [Candidatus Saccharimonadales bacterium]
MAKKHEKRADEPVKIEPVEPAVEPEKQDPEPDVSVQPDTGVEEHEESPAIEPSESTEPALEPAEPTPPRPFVSPEHLNPWQKMRRWCSRHKKTSVLLAVVIVLAVLAAVPFTRYAIAGTVLKQNFSIEAVDAQTHQPVSNATVTLGGKTATTDGQGHVTIRAALGDKTLQITKKYYETASKKVLVGLRKGPTLQVQLKATGRQVPITVTNKMSGKPVENAVVKALDTDAKTDKSGHATLVLPADKTALPATVTATGFTELAVTVQVTATQVAVNNFALTPSGSLFFLSNLSSKIDVVKTALDGSNRQTVLAGTGKENAVNTVLLASRDWKYLALLSKRDGTEKLYLIDTSNNALTTMDEGADVTFGLVGWNNDTFIYTVDRTTVALWQPGQQAIKSFNAATKKLTQLDQTTATGTGGSDYLREQFSTPYILSDEIVYLKNISASYYHAGGASGQQAALLSVHDDGSAKKTIKGFPVPSGSYSTYLQVRPYGAGGLYVEDTTTPEATFYEYEDGQLKQTTEVNQQSFYGAYPTYLLSPSGKQTFWSESRDGKNTLFVGNQDGQNGKQVATLSEYNTYGWYTDDYLLVSKNGSELAILPAGGGQPIKVSDYYKPDVNFRGYGGGYGGL